MTATLFRHWSEVPGRIWHWERFTPFEVRCRGSGAVFVVAAAMEALMRARAAVGRPMVILSAYRSPLHNARVGGAPRSAHKDGIAFDIALAGHDRDALLAASADAGFGSFGKYPTFLHVDLRKGRQWGRW